MSQDRSIIMEWEKFRLAMGVLVLWTSRSQNPEHISVDAFTRLIHDRMDQKLRLQLRHSAGVAHTCAALYEFAKANATGQARLHQVDVAAVIPVLARFCSPPFCDAVEQMIRVTVFVPIMLGEITRAQLCPDA